MFVKLITAEKEEHFQDEVNAFLQSIPKEKLIHIQFTTTPTAIATHTEYGVYPAVEYAAFIQYTK